MTNTRASRQINSGAFTLIELLVVITIIGVLAALIFPAISTVRNNADKTKVKAELDAVKTAIDRYKEKYGYYPPDNPGQPTGFNQLYFELLGTSLKGVDPSKYFETSDGSVQVPVASVTTAFGPAVGGFVNCTKGGDADNAAAAINFLKGLKPGQYCTVTASGVPVRLLTCSVLWPAGLPQPGPVNNTQYTPWHYISSNPTNNPGAYDLWVDVVLGGKTNRISNWSKQPQLVAAPM